MRLRRVIWTQYEPRVGRERYDFLRWLEAQGATVQAWMLEWEVSW